MKRHPDTWNTYVRWVVPAIIAVVVLWVAHFFWASQPSALRGHAASGSSRTTSAAVPLNGPVTTVAPTPNLSTVGPNLLENPGFSLGGPAWTTFYNAKPMGLAYDRSAGTVSIKLNSVTNGVQEVYQFIKSRPDKPLVVTGTLTIAGSALPASSNAEVLIIDASHVSHIVAAFGSKNGTLGAHQFATVIVPKGAATQYVLAVLTGHTSNSSTVVSFKNLRVASQAQK